MSDTQCAVCWNVRVLWGLYRPQGTFISEISHQIRDIGIDFGISFQNFQLILYIPWGSYTHKTLIFQTFGRYIIVMQLSRWDRGNCSWNARPYVRMENITTENRILINNSLYVCFMIRYNSEWQQQNHSEQTAID